MKHRLGARVVEWEQQATAPGHGASYGVAEDQTVWLDSIERTQRSYPQRHDDGGRNDVKLRG
jgi:hypothetical protein